MNGFKHIIGVRGARIGVCLISQAEQPPQALGGDRRDLNLSLGELSPEECRQFIDAYPDIAPDDREVIIQKARGNPYFLGELADGVAAKGELILPDTINDAITMRMDKLDNTAKTMLRRASVIGQRFELETLRHLFRNPSVD